MANEIVFQASILGEQLHQGEVISNLAEYVYDSALEDVSAQTHPYCVIASQECDLARDFEERAQKRETSVRSVLIFPAYAEPRDAGLKADTWRQAKKNMLDRWHVLEGAQPDQDQVGEGLSALVMDFRDFFCMPPVEIYRQLDAGTASRRAMLLSPYREHLQSRAMTYLGRVALYRDHDIS